MYSKEIEELLRYKKYLITVSDYLRIIESPQIKYIKYNDGNYFTIVTEDKYTFNFKIVHNNEN